MQTLRGIRGSSLSARELLIVFLVYLAIAIAYTFPLVVDISTHVPSPGPVLNTESDAALHTWYAWWVQHALVSPDDSVLYSELIFHPLGMEMTMQPAMFLHGALTLPLFWMDITTANNVIILISFALSGLTAFLLGLYLFESVPAAFFCGFVFAFCPYKFQHLVGGHYNLMATATLPLVALSLVRLLDAPGKWNVVWAGIWLGITAYTDYYYFAFALLLSVTIVGYRVLLTPNRLKTLRYSISSGLLAFVVACPLLIPAISSAIHSDYSIASGHEEHKADLLSLIVPSQRQWVAGPFIPLINRLDTEAIDGTEHSVYVGSGLLILCLLYLRRIGNRRGTPQLFVFITLLFLLLALGPHLSINGREDFDLLDGKISLPVSFLMDLPVFRSARAPSRYFIVAALGWAVWSGYALKILLSSHPNLRSRSPVLAIVVVVVTAIEYIIPVDLAAVEKPPWIDIIRSDPAPGIVAHMPMRPYQAALWQTEFERPMMAVYTARLDPEILRYYWRHDALRLFSYPGYVAQIPDKAESKFVVDLVGIRYVAVNRNVPKPSRVRRAETILETSFGMERVFSDDVSALYRYPESFRAFRDLDFTTDHYLSELTLLYGWSNRRVVKGKTATWMTRPGSVMLLPPMHDGDYLLSIDMMLVATGEVKLSVEVRGKEVGTSTLQPGRNHLELSVPRGLLSKESSNQVRFVPDHTVGLPHDTGEMIHPAPYGVPVEVYSEGLFTSGLPRASINISNKKFVVDWPGVLIVHLDSTGTVVPKFFLHRAEGSTAELMTEFILSAPRSATVALATSGSSDLLEGNINQALAPLGIDLGKKYNELSSLAIVGARDGRKPIIDVGPAVAGIVLGRAPPTYEAAIGLLTVKIASL